MFQSLDRLGAMIGLLRDPNASPVACDELVESILAVLDAAGADKKQGSQAEMDRLMKAVANEVAAPLPAAAAAETESVPGAGAPKAQIAMYRCKPWRPRRRPWRHLPMMARPMTCCRPICWRMSPRPRPKDAVLAGSVCFQRAPPCKG